MATKNSKSPLNPDTKNPAVNSHVDQGRMNTQGKEGGEWRQDNSGLDQSEGAKGGGQPTAHQGQGAGFSRNSRHDMS